MFTGSTRTSTSTTGDASLPAAPAKRPTRRRPRRTGTSSPPAEFTLPPPGEFTFRVVVNLGIKTLPAKAWLATDWILYLAMENPDEAKRIAEIVMAEVRKAVCR